MSSSASHNLSFKKDKPSLIISYIGTTNCFEVRKKRNRSKKYIKFILYTLLVFIFLAVAPRF